MYRPLRSDAKRLRKGLAGRVKSGKHSLPAEHRHRLEKAGAEASAGQGHPDGLEKVAEAQSFLDKGFGLWKVAPLPDYLWPGLKNEKLSTGLAGLLGVFLVFLLSVGVGKLIRMKKRGKSA